MSDFELRGADALRDLTTALKRAGDGREIKKELLRELRAVAKPVGLDVQQALGTKLPQRGGLAKKVSKGAKVKVRNKLSGQSAGVQLQVAMKDHDMASIEKGKLRHPVYGRGWVNQKIKPGIVGDAVEADKQLVQGAVLDAIEKAVDAIVQQA